MVTFIRYHCRDSMVIVVMVGEVILMGPLIISYN